MYHEFVTFKPKPKWEKMYCYALFNWKNIFEVLYSVVIETSHQSFQHQFLNRYFPAEIFYICWYNCLECNKTDTLEHEHL